MLGITLAPATAEILAPAVLSGRASLDLAPFSVARFDNRAARDGANRRSTTKAPRLRGAAREGF
jgi:D-amino-acid dehydrogenase